MQDPRDYVQRVEPSAVGGKKMGQFIVNSVLEQLEMPPTQPAVDLGQNE